MYFSVHKVPTFWEGHENTDFILLSNSNQLGDFIKSFGSSQNILIWTLNTFTFLWQKFAGLVCLCTCKLDTNSKYTQWEQNLLLSKVQKSIDFCEYVSKEKVTLYWQIFILKKKTLTILVLVHHLFPAIYKRLNYVCKYSFYEKSLYWFLSKFFRECQSTLRHIEIKVLYKELRERP